MSAPEAIDGTYDPFEEFNRSVGAGVVENPYPLLAMARAKGPATQGEPRGGVARGRGRPPSHDGTGGLHRVQLRRCADGPARRRDVLVAGYADVMGAVMGHTILEMDEPEHHTYRGLVAAGVQP